MGFIQVLKLYNLGIVIINKRIKLTSNSIYINIKIYPHIRQELKLKLNCKMSIKFMLHLDMALIIMGLSQLTQKLYCKECLN